MTDDRIEQARAAWRWRGAERPPFAEEPGPGQESVWDYPRPPRVEPVGATVRVELDDVTIAESDRALRVLETASPPSVYIPPADVRVDLLEPFPRASVCEWKGRAVYWSIRVGECLARQAAWSYPEPWSGFEAIRDHLSFYPTRVGACFLAGEQVRPQPGAFYGGWVTSRIVGPFKGSCAGSGSW